MVCICGIVVWNGPVFPGIHETWWQRVQRSSKKGNRRSSCETRSKEFIHSYALRANTGDTGLHVVHMPCCGSIVFVWFSFVFSTECTVNNRISRQFFQEEKSWVEESLLCREVEEKLGDDIWYSLLVTSQCWWQL